LTFTTEKTFRAIFSAPREASAEERSLDQSLTSFSCRELPWTRKQAA